MFLYEGSHNLIPVYPTNLQQYDLVITTYNVLQNELRLSENGQVLFSVIALVLFLTYQLLDCFATSSTEILTTRKSGNANQLVEIMFR